MKGGREEEVERRGRARTPGWQNWGGLGVPVGMVWANRKNTFYSEHRVSGKGGQRNRSVMEEGTGLGKVPRRACPHLLWLRFRKQFGIIHLFCETGLQHQQDY